MAAYMYCTEDVLLNLSYVEKYYREKVLKELHHIRPARKPWYKYTFN